MTLESGLVALAVIVVLVVIGYQRHRNLSTMHRFRSTNVPVSKAPGVQVIVRFFEGEGDSHARFDATMYFDGGSLYLRATSIPGFPVSFEVTRSDVSSVTPSNRMGFRGYGVHLNDQSEIQICPAEGAGTHFDFAFSLVKKHWFNEKGHLRK